MLHDIQVAIAAIERVRQSINAGATVTQDDREALHVLLDTTSVAARAVDGALA